MGRFKQIEIGELIHRVEIQRNIDPQDATTGEQADGWVTVIRCYAKVEDLSGTEFWTNETLRGIATHLITVRYCSELKDISVRWRALYRGKVYNFANINDDCNRHWKLQIAAKREE